MKKTFLLLLAFLLVGCTGVPPATYCYQITGTTIRTVDLAMTVAGDLYRDGKITSAQKAKLVAAHDVYRPAAQAAVAACKAVQNQNDADRVLSELQSVSDGMLRSLVAAGVLR